MLRFDKKKRREYVVAAAFLRLAAHIGNMSFWLHIRAAKQQESPKWMHNAQLKIRQTVVGLRYPARLHTHTFARKLPPIHLCPPALHHQLHHLVLPHLDSSAIPSHCPSEWTYYSKTDSCYKHFLDAAFDQAETVCTSVGGHLVSIHSEEENTFISGLTHMGIEYKNEKQLTWIGLRKPNYPPNATWAWSDKSALDYLNWAQGKPQDITGLQNCAQMYTDSLDKNSVRDTDFRKWNDVQCSETMRAYVCKQPALH